MVSVRGLWAPRKWNGTNPRLFVSFFNSARRLQKREGRGEQSGELLAVAGMVTAGVRTPTPGSLSQRTTPAELQPAGVVGVPAAGWDQVSNPAARLHEDILFYFWMFFSKSYVLGDRFFRNLPPFTFQNICMLKCRQNFSTRLVEGQKVVLLTKCYSKLAS